MSESLRDGETDGSTFTFRCDVHFRNGRHGKKRMRAGRRRKPAPTPTGSIPRVSRLMALAIRYQRLIAEGAVADYADGAVLGHVTRARMTQIMSLLNLAPDIQEAILFLPRTLSGRDPITERRLRPLTAELGWCEQRRMWDEIKDASTSSQGIETSVVPADRSGGTPSRRTA